MAALSEVLAGLSWLLEHKQAHRSLATLVPAIFLQKMVTSFPCCETIYIIPLFMRALKDLIWLDISRVNNFCISTGPLSIRGSIALATGMRRGGEVEETMNNGYFGVIFT